MGSTPPPPPPLPQAKRPYFPPTLRLLGTIGELNRCGMCEVDYASRSMENVDVERTIREATSLLDEIEKLVRLSTNLGASIEERRTAAMLACERIERSGVLSKLQALTAWFKVHGVDFERGIAAAKLLTSFRRR